MPVFLANRSNLQTKRLHHRLKQRLYTDGTYTDTRLERTSPRDPGTYRVTAETDTQTFLNDSAYPTATARIEVGFELFTADPHEHYWINWIEADRDLLVGWHQDETHPDLGPVHLQVSHGDEPVAHESPTFIDAHPLDVFSRRLAELPTVVQAVEWVDGRATGLDLR